jgi:hypothetical protein
MRSPIVRIFVSSTIRDMASERDLLATRVFPRLERRLRRRSLRDRPPLRSRPSSTRFR